MAEDTRNPPRTVGAFLRDADRRSKAVESELIRTFVNGVSSRSLNLYPAADQRAPLPFANLEWREGGRTHVRSHGLTGQAV